MASFCEEPSILESFIMLEQSEIRSALEMCSPDRAGYAKRTQSILLYLPRMRFPSLPGLQSWVWDAYYLTSPVLILWLSSSVFVCKRWLCTLGSPASNLAALISYCLYSRLHWYKVGVKQSCEFGSSLYPVTWQWEVRAVLLWQEISTDWKVKLDTAKKY